LFRRALLVLGGYYSKESTFMRAASHLYACVAEQALDAALLRAFDIPVRDFQHRHAMLCLHVWMLLVRLRPEGKDGKLLSQLLYEDFQEDVERQVRATGLEVRVSKHLTELEKQFYGSCVAYDRALKGESGESLSTALLRNVLQAAPGKESAAARLERYVRRELACLALTESEAVMMGNVKFSKLE
jgi:cytochrome b pre-mRNA-processing protein 3